MNKILVVLVLFILILSVLIISRGKKETFRKFQMPIQKNKSQYIDLLKFNTILLPFNECMQNQILTQQQDSDQSNTQSIKQNKILPQNLKINDLIKKQQQTDITLTYSLNGEQLTKHFRLVFDNNRAIPVVSHLNSGEQCAFEDNIDVLEFICNQESKVEDLDQQDNNQIDCQTRQVLRFIAIINNNFSDYIRARSFNQYGGSKVTQNNTTIKIKTTYQ